MLSYFQWKAAVSRSTSYTIGNVLLMLQTHCTYASVQGIRDYMNSFVAEAPGSIESKCFPCKTYEAVKELQDLPFYLPSNLFIHLCIYPILFMWTGTANYFLQSWVCTKWVPPYKATSLVLNEESEWNHKQCVIQHGHSLWYFD